MQALNLGRRTLLRAILATLLALGVPARAAPFDIVTTDDSDVTRRIVADLAPRLAAVFAADRAKLPTLPKLQVAIGPTALRQVAQQACDCVVIAAFTSSQVVRGIVDALAPARAGAITAVYAEPAPADQLRLIELLYRRPVRVAALVGHDTAFLKPLLAERGVTVLDAGTDADGGEDAGINRLLNRSARSEVLLALPDSAVYNAGNLRNILLSTYRHKQGVIGFSGDMVRAGALASTYSDIADIDIQVAEVAAAWAGGAALAPPRFPQYFRTVVNEGVARSLDVAVDASVRGFARRPGDRR